MQWLQCKTSFLVYDLALAIAKTKLLYEFSKNVCSLRNASKRQPTTETLALLSAESTCINII